MSCDTFKPLLMGYLDEELTELEALRVERHLQGCGNRSSELQEFRKLKEVTDDMRVIVPEDKYWDQYWSNVYNPLERKIGWILISMGSIVLLAYAIYTLGETFIFGKHIPLLVRVGVIALVGGLCTLLISVLRERWFISKSTSTKGSDDDHCHHRSSQRSQRCPDAWSRQGEYCSGPARGKGSHGLSQESGWRRTGRIHRSHRAVARAGPGPNGQEARSLGANAVVGLRLSTSYVTYGANPAGLQK